MIVRSGKRRGFVLVTVAAVAVVGVAIYERGIHDNHLTANAPIGAGGPPVARHEQAVHGLRPPPSSSTAVAAAQGKSTTDWRARFRSATDLRDVVRKAATAAVGAHDGRAAFVVYEALAECADLLRVARQGPAALQDHLRWLADLTAAAPEFVIKRRENSVRRCLPLTEPGLFEGIPVSNSDRASAAYWRDRASSDGDPLALIEALAQEKAVRRTDPSGQTIVLSASEIALEVARSNDPEALYLLGQRIFADTGDSARMDGLALSLAVCLGGYDCTSTNPDIGPGECDASGTCTGGWDFVAMVQQSLPASQYAKLYAKAQDIQAALQRGDRSAVESIVSHARLGGSP